MYFIKDKRYTRNPKESSHYPEATVGLKQRTVSCPQDRLRTGGPKQETLPLPRLQLLSTTPPSTPIYNSSLLLLSTEPTTDYCGRSTYRVNYYYYYYYYCYRHYRDGFCLQSQELQEVWFRALAFSIF